MIKSDLGAVTAYADAVAHGYTGTREDFGKLLAGAGKNLEDAVDASNAAEAAAENAENAAQTAADAAGVAGRAAGEAAQSAEAAETAKQRAEDAAKKALEAKTGSENALQDAGAAKDAASGYADAAAKSATAAAASKTNAAKSENSAADSAAAAKKSAEDADNTANSIKDSMAQISENKEAVSKLKEDTTALQKRQNVLVGSETGNPVSCDDAFAAPLCGLHIYGKSTQNGTPTPDAPVPIVSAGDGGTIVVTLSNGNDKTQTLTLPTPNGLPGIPVTSGGNYTDPTGQQWVCDEVDLERGVKVQRVKRVDISSLDKSYWDFRSDTGADTSSTRYKNDAVMIDFKSNAPTMNNILPVGVANIKNTFRLVATPLYLYQFNLDASEFPTVKSWTEYLEANTVLVIYALAIPIETPLTPAEIAAYKALTTYAPDTVVQASDDAGIKLCYQRDVNLVVKNLEDAIASMTTT